jgi:hypothetical protein
MTEAEGISRWNGTNFLDRIETARFIIFTINRFFSLLPFGGDFTIRSSLREEKAARCE